MKATYKNFFKSTLFLSLFFVFASSAHAQFSISEVVKSIIPSQMEKVLDGSNEKVEPQTKTVDKKIKKDANRDVCEYYSDILEDTLTLENASLDARAKIEKIENTLLEEGVVRDSILDSIKNLVGLKENDKTVFSSMRKDIEEANGYYDILDEKVGINQEFLDSNFCENMRLKTLVKVASDTAYMVEDEAYFRKQFVTALKEKMRVLQEGVKNAKK